ncbi:hypothetical protein FE257_004758 [Aspergillus nanangensis]|uniref:WSC domain-containing protein n=1 Tax=Aspergillus nanangensis TaxID=2582783 RepID=A0AAD4GV05_ASPNN|nr:hypothetical protein FE257_004758 [Aspergillus nanangensis]
MKFQLAGLIFAVALSPVAAQKYEGCFGTPGSLESQGVYPYQSPGYCEKECTNQGSSVMGLTGGDACYCGNELPPKASAKPDSKCNVMCAGWPVDNCGGNGAWSVYSIGSQS